jgi:hypothetical protein
MVTDQGEGSYWRRLEVTCFCRLEGETCARDCVCEENII